MNATSHRQHQDGRLSTLESLRQLKKHRRREDLVNVSRRVVSPACITGVLTSTPCETSRSCRATKQLQVTFETLFPSRVVDRPPKKISRALPDREVQPLDKRSIQFRGVLGVAQRLFESPRVADQRSSLDLDDAIVPTGLDHLAVQTSWPQNATDNSLVKLKAVCGDQGDTFKIHSAGYVLKEGEPVSVASSSYDGRSQSRAETSIVVMIQMSIAEAPPGLPWRSSPTLDDQVPISIVPVLVRSEYYRLLDGAVR